MVTKSDNLRDTVEGHSPRADAAADVSNPTASEQASLGEPTEEAVPSLPLADDAGGAAKDKEAAPVAAAQANAKRPASKVARASKRRSRTPAAETAEAAGHAEEEPAKSDDAAPFAFLQPFIVVMPPSPGGVLPPELQKLFPDTASACALLVAVAAATSPDVRFVAGKDVTGDAAPAALRLALVGEKRELPKTIEPVLHAAFEVQAIEAKQWMANQQKGELLRTAADTRRRDYQQLLGSASRLGLSSVAEAANAAVASPPTSSPPRPQFVARETAPSKLRPVLETARGGVLVVDDSRMPSVAGWGVNFNTEMADLLNRIAAGRGAELVDPSDNCVRLRLNVNASVIGRLSPVDIYSLYKAEPAALAATIIVCVDVAAAAVPAQAAAKTLTGVLTAVRKLTESGHARALCLSTPARKLLDQAKARFARLAASQVDPLAGYYKAAADLAVRVAGVLMIVDTALSGADKLAAEVGQDAVGRAIAFVEQCALPAARGVLRYSSVDPVLNHARRVVSYAQQYATAGALVKQWDIGRLLRHSMTPTELEAAIRRLVADGVFECDPKVNGKMFRVGAAVFEARHQLPDLVTDQRRLKD